MSDDNHFTDARPVMAEGARIGLVTCLKCGACIVLDQADEVNALYLHRRWHADLTRGTE